VVKHLTKLVAALLLLVLFGTALVAVANCSPKLAMAGHCGGEHCPMIVMHARQQANTQVSEIPSGKGSCCKVTNTPVAIFTPAIAPGSQVTVQPDDIQTGTIPGSLLSTSAPAILTDVSATIAPSPQALLCTFLV
jgi:hypothetical protein